MKTAERLRALGATEEEVSLVLGQLSTFSDEEVYKILLSVNPELAHRFRSIMHIHLMEDDGRLLPFEKEVVEQELYRETDLSRATASKVASEVEEWFRNTSLTLITKDIVRTVTLVKLVELGHERAMRKYYHFLIPASHPTDRSHYRRYTLLFLIPEARELVADKILAVKGMDNPFVLYSRAYVDNRELDRWLEGFASFSQTPTYAKKSVFVTEEVKELKGFYSFLKKNFVVWEKGEAPLYDFGRADTRSVLEVFVVDTQRIQEMARTSSQEEQMVEQVVESIRLYTERKKKLAGNGKYYVKVKGEVLPGLESLPLL